MAKTYFQSQCRNWACAPARPFNGLTNLIYNYAIVAITQNRLCMMQRWTQKGTLLPTNAHIIQQGIFLSVWRLNHANPHTRKYVVTCFFLLFLLFDLNFDAFCWFGFKSSVFLIFHFYFGCCVVALPLSQPFFLKHKINVYVGSPFFCQFQIQAFRFFLKIQRHKKLWTLLWLLRFYFPFYVFKMEITTTRDLKWIMWLNCFD